MTVRDRVAIFGAQQTGKSTIALEIYRRWSRFLGFDPKAESWLLPPNTAVARSGSDAASRFPGRVMYYPPMVDLRRQRADFDVAVQKVIERRGGGIVIHEGHALVDEDNCPPALDVALWQGPGMEIPMVYCFQEPVRIWRPFFSQANVVIVTAFSLRDHWRILARELGAPALGEPHAPDFSFTVWRRADPRLGIAESLAHFPPLR